ncbi:Tyrosine kinase catalytic domain containing protein [Ceratobasidium theobromae]|uniref:Tyrosine kinase catalytic domain containing protein n=1 Tax=Ceratobasidium theobromae TaxID=1582974 RepID=A0A5N5QDI2_9AGAM|nr:Tyrosine kinase catalytic domain containing protein [Ceratobasidium theobromae]
MDIQSNLEDWANGIEDYSQRLSAHSKETVTMKRMADVIICRAQGDSAPAFLDRFEAGSFEPAKDRGSLMRFIVKVPRMPWGLSNLPLENDPFMEVLHPAIKQRSPLKHNNLVSLIGLDTSFGRFPGLVLEYCPYGDLTRFKSLVAPNEKDLEKYVGQLAIIYARVSGGAYTRSFQMRDILQGLQYLHGLPSAIAHGDLTPENILVDGKGTLKLSTISFARLAASRPSHKQLQKGALTIDDAISARYLSPELLDIAWPTPKSDMWSFGCVAFWLFTDLQPYSKLRREYQIVAAIDSGQLPHGMGSTTDIEELGSQLVSGASSHWITNGTMLHILRCWDAQLNGRPTAAEFLKFLDTTAPGA